ncbi:hypothetical protein [Pseudomonas orientalis]|uniref:hypothetical protein n=1 Tax=Pseudomonas orientalis TaxID=76758 RepID=UPI0012FFDAE3|nr:hypothetical protein [Pseudomonas orientalis]
MKNNNDTFSKGLDNYNTQRTKLKNQKIEQIKRIAKEESLDLTVTLAKRLFIGIFDQSIKYELLVEHFGTPNRTASAKSEDSGRIDSIIRRNKPSSKTL